MKIYVERKDMPKSCEDCPMGFSVNFGILCTPTHNIVGDSEISKKQGFCPLVTVQPHGRLIDADALIADIKRQCREVFRVDAVSPDDFWITRNEAYNERLWKTWCESFFDYLGTRPTIIPAEEGET